MEEKVHTKAVADVSRCAGLVGTFIFSTAVPKDLKIKFRSKFNHGFTNRGCLHCAILKVYNARDKQFFPSKCST